MCMGKYKIGDKVIKINSEGRGVVLEVMPPCRGRQLYKVNWGSITTDELEVNLLLDCDISDPYERCVNGIFSSYSEYSKKNTTFKILNSNNSTISSLKASKTIFKSYQFKPLLKFLNSRNRRLLVADEVGLGKTIEAGHIMLELKARRELHNVLIICPKSLQQKWKDELFFKFGFRFKIYENTGDLIDDIKTHRVVHAIVNYEKIRMKKQSKEEKQQKEKSKEEKNDLIEFLSKNEFKFSLVLCDEAHKMRNSETQTYHGAEIVMSQADAVVFLTATPIMISEENLYNLLHLLDNKEYSNYQVFKNKLQENRPFVKALTDLNNQVPFLKIKEDLEESDVRNSFYSNDVEIKSYTKKVKDIFSGDVMYEEIHRLLQAEDTYENRAKLQYLISSMNVMNGVFSRTRKREVTTDLSQAERKPHLIKVVLTEKEQTEFNNVINQYEEENSGEADLLGLIQKKRQISSSVYAYLNSENNLDNGIDEYEKYPDAKFNELIKIIEEVFKHGIQKIVIFALFHKTLKYLKIRFEKYGLGVLMIYGMTKNRAEVLDEFKNNNNAHILLSSEVGSEGLDMQFCNSMVNYDLPWNPMVIEQRIGRVDRFGQKSPVVNIYNIVVADSIQEDIYIRLLDRIGIFRGTIGDIEAILDAPMEKNGRVTIQEIYAKLEKDLYVSCLTEEEKLSKISEIELAVANESESIKRLKEGLEGSLTNDAYFKDEINRIQNNNAYVTDRELKNYLESVIRQELTTCMLEEKNKDVFELKLPMSNPRLLCNFLVQNQPEGEEINSMFKQFKHEIEDCSSMYITFNQQKAYENNKLLFLNIYHPIIQACLCYFRKKEDQIRTTFCYAIKSDDLLTKGKVFYLVVYKMVENKNIIGVNKVDETLLPLVYDIEEKRIVRQENLVNHLFSKSQMDGVENNPSSEYVEFDLIQDMRYDFAESISEEKNKRLSEIKLQMESERQRNERQIREYYTAIIDNQRNYIKKWEFDIWVMDDTEEIRKRNLQNAINLTKDRIKRLEEEFLDRMNEINKNVQIDIKESIVSLSLISII